MKKLFVIMSLFLVATAIGYGQEFKIAKNTGRLELYIGRVLQRTSSDVRSRATFVVNIVIQRKKNH